MSREPSRTESPKKPYLRWVLSLIVVALILGLFLNNRHTDEHHAEGDEHDEAAHKNERDPRRRLPGELSKTMRRDGEPQGAYEYMFDKAPNANRFLIAKGNSKNFVPDSDAAAGWD